MKTKIQNKKKSRIFIILLVLVIAVILIINFTAFNKEKPKSGYNIPCNVKFSGVIIENKCYDCGSLDKVCPKDFGANCKIKDPDCS